MQLVLPWGSGSKGDSGKPKRPEKAPSVLQVGTERYPLTIARHRRARRYVLRMTAEGGLRLTVPRGASVAGGLAFVQTQHDWIVRERLRRATRQRPWESGTLIWFRGAQVPLAISGAGMTFADQVVRGATPATVNAGAGPGVRETVEAHLRTMAEGELPSRCLELAALHGLSVARVSVRNQRSRWGSCSTRGTIALNWRLIQMPVSVSDYVVLHELMHIRQPNHSRQFWREVASVCDHWREAERWLRQHGRELL